jgi:hypothetical protein
MVNYHLRPVGRRPAFPQTAEITDVPPWVGHPLKELLWYSLIWFYGKSASGS